MNSSSVLGGIREPSENKLSWVMDEIQGETHMATDRAADPRALKDLADAMLQEQAAACPTAGRQGGEAPGEGAQIRRFECKDGDKTIHHVIVSIDSGRQAAHFVMSSPNRAQLDDFTRVISDRKLLF